MNKNSPSQTKMLIFVLIALILLSITAIASGISPFNSSVKIGYIENNTLNGWTAQYLTLEGTMQRNIESGPNNIDVEIKSDSGVIDVVIIGTDGTVFYSGTEIPTSSFKVAVTENVSIKIQANMHRGGFSIKW